MGGGGGTALGTSAMRPLPIGVPKLIVSTIAAADTSPYVGSSDIMMMPSIVDVAGLNRISRTIFANAAAAVCGMVKERVEAPALAAERPLIAASKFGNTTRAVEPRPRASSRSRASRFSSSTPPAPAAAPWSA